MYICTFVRFIYMCFFIIFVGRSMNDTPAKHIHTHACFGFNGAEKAKQNIMATAHAKIIVPQQPNRERPRVQALQTKQRKFSVQQQLRKENIISRRNAKMIVRRVKLRSKTTFLPMHACIERTQRIYRFWEV